MNIILKHNHFDGCKLAQIIEEMKIMGAPTIKVYQTENEYDEEFQAIEGCHRLRACKILGIEPIIVILDSEELLENHKELDHEGTKITVGEIENTSRWERPYKVNF